MIAVLLAYLSTLALSIDMSPAKEALSLRALAESFTVSPVLQLALCVLLYKLYSYCMKQDTFAKIAKGRKVGTVILSVLFTVFILLGQSIYAVGSLGQLLCGKFGLVKAIIRFTGLVILFFFALNRVFLFLDNAVCTCESVPQSGGKNLFSRWCDALYRKPFKTAFITILIFYIPYSIFTYPAILMGDSYDIMGEMYYLPFHLNYLQLVDPEVTISNHHPVFFVLLVHCCLQIGLRLFHSANIGIYILSLIQLFFSLAVFSTVISMLVSLNARKKVVLPLMLYFIVAPNIQEYMMMNTKDVLYMCAFVLFCCALFSILHGKKLLSHDRLWLAVSAALIFLLRNDGKYLLVSCLAVLIIAAKKGNRKYFAVMLAAIVVSSFLYSSVLLPAFHITPGSRRELFSVPIQQTARYVRDLPDEVTPEEKAGISEMLDYDQLAEKYDPELSDPVKGLFNDYGSNEQLAAYLKTWFSMFFKHPIVYVEATLNNYYNYFYPSPVLVYSDDYTMTALTFIAMDKYTPLKDYGITFTQPEVFDSIRLKYEAIREAVFTMPVLNVLKSTAMYVWAFMLMFVYLIYRKEYLSAVSFVPVLVTILVCFVGPCNGDYFRYAYGISVAVPAMSCIYLCAMKNKE